MSGKGYDRQFELSAAKMVLEGEIPVKGLPDQHSVPCRSLRRWAAEYEADGEGVPRKRQSRRKQGSRDVGAREGERGAPQGGRDIKEFRAFLR